MRKVFSESIGNLVFRRNTSCTANRTLRNEISYLSCVVANAASSNHRSQLRASGAWSACRAGYPTTTLDLFADRDTSEMTDCHTIRSFPDSIVEQASEFRDHRIVLAGGMENFPNIVSTLETTHTIMVRMPSRWLLFDHSTT